MYKESKNLTNSIIKRQKRLAKIKTIKYIEEHKINPRQFFKQYKSVKEGNAKYKIVS